MPVARIRPPGRPSEAERQLYEWAFVLGKEIEMAQQDLRFVASGDSLKDYAVVIAKKNTIHLLMADYIKYSISGRGRRPGGKMAPLNSIIRWIEQKGIAFTGSIKSLAYLIARKQQKEGNAVYRGERPGIPLEMLIDESFDMISNQIAFNVANDAANRLVKRIMK
jgi:hypothetical protein